jgi:7-carboxy-7-deazaguanine synthase
MEQIIPNNTWTQDHYGDVHLVITGGEPLLGWQRAYPELIDSCMDNGLQNITFETNGTQALSKDFKTWLEDTWYEERGYQAMTFSISAKLPVSGEKWEEAILPDVVVEYEKYGYCYLKFVVATEQDVKDVDRAVELYREAGFKGPVYLMPVGGLPEDYHLNTAQVAELAMEKGYRYSPRLQVDIWRNAWGT